MTVLELEEQGRVLGEIINNQSLDSANNQAISSLMTEERNIDHLNFLSNIDATSEKIVSHLVHVPVPVRSLSFDGFSVLLIGQIYRKKEIEKRYIFEKDSHIYRAVFIQNGCPVGAVLINADDEKEKFCRLINEKTCLDSLENDVFKKGFRYGQFIEENGQKAMGSRGG